MIDITDVGKIRRYKDRGYVLINTVTEQVEMHSAYSYPELQYIGDTREAYHLWNKFGITGFYPIREYTPATLDKSIADRAKNLLKYGDELIPQLQQAKVCCIGWSPREQKWYGWSHRAIYGFTIGSTVEKGDAGFMPSNKEDFIDDLLNFWDMNKDGSWHLEDSYRKRLLEYKKVEIKGRSGIEIKSEIQFFGRQEGRKSEIQTSFEPYPEWGKGEWTAMNLEDAKQMAIDFAEGVG